MEGNMSQGGMIPGNPSYGGLDLQRSVQMQSQGHSPHQLHQYHSHGQQTAAVHPSVHDVFPLTMGTFQCGAQMISMGDFNKGERCKNSASDEDDPSFTEDGVDGHSEMNKGKKGSPWQRVKWTDNMVRLLITAVSYVGEDASSESSDGGRRKFAVLQKKGKWKSISKVLAQRGYHVSPQQCEDKFNDLNKRYKKLNDMLGRGTSCQVVEKPALLDVIDFLSEKEKDDVRKILSSKHLFYEEMCSYHNNNRLHLPHDQALQRSLRLALHSRDDQDHPDARRSHHDDFDEDDLELENDDRDDYEENHPTIGDGRGNCGISKNSAKRLKRGPVREDVSYETSLNMQWFNKSSHNHSPVLQPDMNQPCSNNSKTVWLQKQWVESRTLQLEEQKLQIQLEMLELEKQRFKWERFCRKRDRELEKLKMENEKMKLENDSMALELRRKEMSSNFSKMD